MSIIPSRWALVNGVNLNTVPGLQVSSIDPPGQGTRSLNIFPIGRRSARKLTSAFYTQNTFAIGVFITANSRALLEQALDTLYQIIQGSEAAIIVPQSANTRQYTGTYSKTVWNNNKQNTNSPIGNVADIVLLFELSDNYGYDVSFTSIEAARTITAGLFNTAWNQLGGADWQAPFFQAQYTTSSPGAGTVTIGNANTGQSVNVTRTWNQFDILQVDSRNKTVQVNGVDAPFTGAIPEFQNTLIGGTQTAYYQDTFASRTVKLTYYVYNRYN